MAFRNLPDKVATDKIELTDYEQVRENFRVLNARSGGGGGGTAFGVNQVVTGSDTGNLTGVTLPNGQLLYGTATAIAATAFTADGFVRYNASSNTYDTAPGITISVA